MNPTSLRFLFVLGATLVAFPAPRADAQRAISKDVYKTEMGKALDGIEAKSKAARRGGPRLKLHANLFLAHEAFIAATPLEVLVRAVDAFKEAGVSQVDVNMGLFPWLGQDKPTIEKYDALLAHIRKSGMQVAINPQYSPIRHKVSGIDEWQRQVLPIYAEIATRYRPDTFVVVHEPTTMAARMRAQTTPKQWADFARAAAKVVKEKSPATRIGAGGLQTERKYFDAFLELPEIQVMTLDVYNLRALPTFGEMTRAAQKKGKPVYIEETWRPPFFTPEPSMSLDAVAVKGVGDPDFQELDVKWIRAIAAWASAMGIEGITPVWMQTFFTYGGSGTEAFDPGYLKQVMTAIDKGERTPAFQALREITR